MVGVWGGIVRRALAELLPEDAAERASGRVRLRLTAWPSLQPLHVERFGSREHLIDACLASGHLPLLLDGRWTARVQGGAPQPLLPLGAAGAARRLPLHPGWPLDGRWVPTPPVLPPTPRTPGLRVMDGAFSRWAERLLPHRPAGAELPEHSPQHAQQPPPTPLSQQQQQQQGQQSPAADLRRVVLDFSFDPALHPLPTFGAVRLQSVEQPGLLLQRGWEYGRRLQREGVWGAWMGLAPQQGRAWQTPA